eukprot:SAG11_NODE_23077_length_395_cov_1.219595_1_plen_42_part_10
MRCRGPTVDRANGADEYAAGAQDLVLGLDLRFGEATPSLNQP